MPFGEASIRLLSIAIELKAVLETILEVTVKAILKVKLEVRSIEGLNSRSTVVLVKVIAHNYTTTLVKLEWLGNCIKLILSMLIGDTVDQ